jgi:hypothetical protein
MIRSGRRGEDKGNKKADDVEERKQRSRKKRSRTMKDDARGGDRGESGVKST